MTEPDRASGRGLRVCLVGDGTSVHVRRWATDLVAAGCRVALLSYSPAQTIPGVRVHRARPVPPVLRQAVSGAAARAFLMRVRPDIVHLHYLPFGPRAVWPLGIGQLVVSPYGSDVAALPRGWRGWLGQRILHVLLRRAAGIVAASEHLMSLTRTMGSLQHDAVVEVIGFGVDCDRFRPSADAVARRETGDRPLVIGYAKGLREYYGPLDLLEAVAAIRSGGHDVRLRIAGSGPLEDTIRRRVAESGLDGSVDVLGQLPDERLPSFYASLDIFAMPSHREAYGVAALEAAASGVPVVATRTGGIPEVLADGTTAILVPPRNPAALAEALARLASDPDLRRRMAEAGRADTCRRHARRDAVGKMLDFYGRVMVRAAR